MEPASTTSNPEPPEHLPPALPPHPAEANASAEAPLRTCPNCGAALEERACKLHCPRPACGYYASCSDYY